MPSDLFTIPPVSDVKTLHRELNDRLRRISLQLAALSGYDAKQVNLTHPLDLGGKKIQNVALPLGRDGDVVTCGYLRNYGLLPVEGRSLNVQVPAVFVKGIQVTRKASAASDVVTLGQLASVISASATPPGGVNTNVQFNDSGALGGDPKFIFDKVTGALSLGDATHDGLLRGPAVGGRKLTFASDSGAAQTRLQRTAFGTDALLLGPGPDPTAAFVPPGLLNVLVTETQGLGATLGGATWNDTPGVATSFFGFKARGTIASPTPTQNQDVFFLISGSGTGPDNKFSFSSGPVIKLEQDSGATAPDSLPTCFTFETNDVSKSHTAIRLGIRQNGRVQVGNFQFISGHPTLNDSTALFGVFGDVASGQTVREFTVDIFGNVTLLGGQPVVIGYPFGGPGGYIDVGFYDGDTNTNDAPAPAVKRCRVYLRDNGAGKAQLVARFNTGAVQVIATQP